MSNYTEGPEAFKNFDNAMKKLIAVPHAVVQERIAEHRKVADQNPRKRGPKPKSSTKSSGDV
jgi:hypothetical protein